MMYYIYLSGTQDVLCLLVMYTGCIVSTGHVHRMYCIYRSRARMRGILAYSFYGHFCRWTPYQALPPEYLNISILKLRRASCNLDNRSQPSTPSFRGHIDKRAEQRTEQLSAREDERLPLCVAVGQVREHEPHLERNIRIARRLDGRAHAPPPISHPVVPFTLTIVNLVLVWRHVRSSLSLQASSFKLHGRRNWDLDLVWVGVGWQFTSHAPAFGVWLTATSVNCL